MTPDAAAAALALVGELDVRDALSSVQCPTLVLHRANDAFVDERHSRYATAHIPGARYVEIGARAGREVARARGRQGGRPRLMTDEKLAAAIAMRERAELTMAQIAAVLKVSRATLYHHLEISAHAAEKAA